MVAALLTGLGGLFSSIGGNSQLAAIQAAGTLQMEQAFQLYRDNTQLSMQLAPIMNQASKASLVAQASAGIYTLDQNSKSALMEAHLKAANKWISVLNSG